MLYKNFLKYAASFTPKSLEGAIGVTNNDTTDQSEQDLADRRRHTAKMTAGRKRRNKSGIGIGSATIPSEIFSGSSEPGVNIRDTKVSAT